MSGCFFFNIIQLILSYVIIVLVFLYPILLSKIIVTIVSHLIIKMCTYVTLVFSCMRPHVLEFLASPSPSLYSSRMIEVQVGMAQRALELLALPEDTPSFILDVGYVCMYQPNWRCFTVS